MKKLLMLLVVIAMVAPAMATDVQFEATTDGLTVTVTYAVTDGTVRGMALNVDADVDVDAVGVDSFFDVFMDAAYGDPENYALGDGTPIASQDVAGEIALSSNMFCISMGNLEGTPEGETRTNVDQIVLTAAAAGTGTLDINTLRGAIVDTDGAAVTSNLPIDLTWEDDGPDECQSLNLTRWKDGGIDPVLNVADVMSIVNYISANKINPTTFLVIPTQPAYDADYNLDTSSPAIGVADVMMIVNYISANQVNPTTFLAVCTY